MRRLSGQSLPLKPGNLSSVPETLIKTEKDNSTKLSCDHHMCSRAHKCLHTPTQTIIINTFKTHAS